MGSARTSWAKIRVVVRVQGAQALGCRKVRLHSRFEECKGVSTGLAGWLAGWLSDKDKDKAGSRQSCRTSRAKGQTRRREEGVAE